MSGLRYTENTKKEVVDLYKRQHTVAAIAKMPGMPSKKTIRAILAEYKVPLRGNPRQYDREQILRELETMPAAKVAARHGCSERVIYKLKRKEAES